jgi:23S rRNA pseudouridine2605 synthase
MAYSGRSGSRKPGGNSGNRSKRGSGDSKPAWKRGGSRGGDDDKPAFRKRREDRDDDRPRKSFGDRGPKKSFGDKPAFRKRREDGDEERPRKSFGDRGPKKSFGDKPAFRKRREDGDDDRPRKSFGDRGPKKSFGDKPAFRKRREDGDDERPRKSYGDRDGFKKKSFGDRDDRGGFKKKSFGERGGAPSWKRGGRDESSFTSKKRSRNENDGEWETFENESASGYLKKSESKAPRSGGAKSHRGQSFGSAQDDSDSDGKIRLNKYIANTGLCSRREADEMIEAGVIKVNGVIVTQLGTKVGPQDKVHYGDQLLRREKMVYVLLNKPKDYITTTDDPQERKTVLDLVGGAGDERIYPVGRLDRNTTGVLLLTNDGDLAERLMHPKYNVEKIYQVSLDMNLRKEDFNKILEGVELEDGFIKADDISFVGDGEDHKEVGIVLHSGRNRIVRRVFEHLGYTVKHLDRVAYAGLTKKNVQRGKWRFLESREVGFLKMKVGGEKKVKGSK